MGFCVVSLVGNLLLVFHMHLTQKKCWSGIVRTVFLKGKYCMLRKDNLLLHPFPWNNLQLSVHSTTLIATCRKHLKTHLPDLAFPLQTPAHPVAC